MNDITIRNNQLSKQERDKQLEQFIWDKVTWLFKITPQGQYKEGRITAEWPGGPSGGYTLIFNTRDAVKMSQWEWIAFNQQQVVKDIITRLEIKYKDNNGYYVNGVWYPYEKGN